MTRIRLTNPPSCSTWLSLLGLVGFLVWSCASTQAQQFSADLVTTHVDGTLPATVGKLRVSNDKVRIATPEFADGFFLVDGANRTTYFARPVERIFMEARQSSRLPQLFVTVDPNDPCPQWQIMAKLADASDSGDPWRCERIGEEIVDGRSTAAYRAISSSGRDIVAWIDPDLKFPLRIRTEDGAIITVRNIQEGPQSARLFEIPSIFHKFDPQALIQRIKQSDVWVETPTR